MEKQNTQMSVNYTNEITELILFCSFFLKKQCGGEWGGDFTEGFYK